jgi:hypothetical protein
MVVLNSSPFALYLPTDAMQTCCTMGHLPLLKFLVGEVMDITPDMLAVCLPARLTSTPLFVMRCGLKPPDS